MNKSLQNCQIEFKRLSVDFFDDSVFADDKEVLSIGIATVWLIMPTIGLSVFTFTTTWVVSICCSEGS